METASAKSPSPSSPAMGTTTRDPMGVTHTPPPRDHSTRATLSPRNMVFSRPRRRTPMPS